MFPVLFSIGPVTVYTFGFLLGTGFFLASFLIWRRLRELGRQEEKIIDLLVIGGLWGLFFSRLFYIGQNFAKFGFSFNRWLLLGRYPGLSFWGALLGFFLALARFSKKQKADFWQLADEISFGILPFLILAQLGCFFDGCLLGRQTSMPWGMYFPGSLLRRQPVSLFAVVFLLLIWFFLLRIERRWRMWEWYKSKASGFVFLVFLGLLLGVSLLLAFWQDIQVYFFWLQISLSFLGLLIIGFVFYRRSGRQFRRSNEKEKAQK